MKNRIGELDSIRGLAALTVIIGHILNTFPPLPKALLYSPLRIFWAGHEAVILFFMLSGFVLTLPFIKNKELNYGLYLVKRFLRIYVPYITAVFFGLILMTCFYNSSGDNIRWVNNFWNDSVNFQVLISHVLLINDFNTDAVDPVIWSLVHEMRISIIFPFIVLFILRIKWVQSLLLAISLSVCGALISYLGLDVSQGYLTSYAHSIHYSAMFIMGSLIAINRAYIVQTFNKFGVKIKLSFFVAGICIYTLQLGLSYFVGINTGLFFREWFIALGAGILIIVAISSSTASKYLSIKPIRFLGEISYSLYLYHLPLIIAGLYLLNGLVPKSIIYLFVLPLIFVVSTLSWNLVEKTSIRFGKYISMKWREPNEVSETSEKQIS